MGRGADLLTPFLIDDPVEMAGTRTLAGRYTAAMACDGVGRFIANATSQVRLLLCGNAALPVTIDDGGYGRSYVASPHSAYVLYAREEMDLVGMTRGRRSAYVALSMLDLALKSARFNKAVHLDNWLLSTNLHGDWKGEALSQIRCELAGKFPDHFIILRTLDRWSSPQLLEAALADGWILVPARQIWVVDDLRRDWRPRNAFGNDRRALVRSGLQVEEVEHLDETDCKRVAELYKLLYVDRYSALNPQFTADFISLTLESGMMRYRVARDGAGQIMCVAGMLERDGIMTPSVVGYDTERPQSEALYRIASYLFCDWAMERGYALHGSAGAAHFKRLRGARGVIEYLAVHADHLSSGRRMAVSMLAATLERFVVPMMKREGW